MSALPDSAPQVAAPPVSEMTERAMLMEITETMRAVRQVIELIGNSDSPMTRMIGNMFGIKG